MNYEKIFPKILEKTYKNHKDISTSNLPKVKINSFILGKKIICLPFMDIININEILEEDIKEQIDFEIKISESNENLKDIKKELIKKGFEENIVKGHIISKLTTEEDFWKRFHKHTRNDIRKAEKSGLVLKNIDSLKELKNFYDLYLKEMRNFGTPQQSFKFFKNCFELMRNSFFGLNCYKNKKIAGSIILFINNENAYVSFNISNPNFREFKPNDLLYWESIKWCIKSGIKNLDIGQIDLEYEKNSREESLLKFKRKWLGKEYKRIYFTRGFKIEKKSKDKLNKFRKYWKKIPIFIIKIFGPIINSQIAH